MKAFFGLMLVCVFCSTLSCDAKSHEQCEARTAKTYVDPQAIRITKDGIFLFEHGCLTPVERVSKDERGVYVEKRYVAPCSRCGRNYDWDKFHHCPNCGYMN